MSLVNHEHMDVEQARKAFGLALQEFRTVRGMTQKQFARKLKMLPRMLASFENGTRRASPKTLARFAKALDMPYDKLQRAFTQRFSHETVEESADEPTVQTVDRAAPISVINNCVRTTVITDSGIRVDILLTREEGAVNMRQLTNMAQELLGCAISHIVQ